MGTIPGKKEWGRVKQQGRRAVNHSHVVILGSAVIYVAAAGIFVVEVWSVHSIIYREIHVQSSFLSTCPEKIRGHDRHLPVAKSGTQFVESTIGISQVPRREHKKKKKKKKKFLKNVGRWPVGSRSVAGRWSKKKKKKRRSAVLKRY